MGWYCVCVGGCLTRMNLTVKIRRESRQAWRHRRSGKETSFIKNFNIFLTTITFGVRAGYGPETGLDCLGCERRLVLGVEKRGFWRTQSAWDLGIS